ncbi:volume-regulated anion channel subunit LRRC8A-like [Acropora millepora]|uniref:volume-regulated anion channel subunit LRRC8A-like n=1 Tax=Acropora millepora TaxID=45264 RepID=UPI001CF36569|nr:volume-regulated anion channel subunit LRRC8A-like [Acropora millepora]
MDLEKPEFDSKKMVTTWWDLIDHYLLAVMFAVSLVLVGLQTTQDRLICIPTVHCANLARNDSVVGKWSRLSNMLDVCNRSPSLVVQTTLPDRRQYDYIENECSKKIHWFSAYYSLVFLVEAAILLAISSFWQKCPDSANSLAHCEYLVSEIMTGEFNDEGEALVRPGEGGEQEREEQEAKKIAKRLGAFRKRYSQKITKFNLSSLTWQYRLRGIVGLIFATAMLILNAVQYSLSTGLTQCHLDGHVVFSTEHRFFQCTRSMETFFHVSSILLIVLLSWHLVFVFGSFLWSVTGERRGPEYYIPLPGTKEGSTTYYGDAAFLLHFLRISKYGIFMTFLQKKKEEEERIREMQKLLEQNEELRSTCV